MDDLLKLAMDLRAKRPKPATFEIMGAGQTLNLSDAFRKAETVQELSKAIRQHNERWERFRARWAGKSGSSSRTAARMAEVARDVAFWQCHKAGFDYTNPVAVDFVRSIDLADLVSLIELHRRTLRGNRVFARHCKQLAA